MGQRRRVVLIVLVGIGLALLLAPDALAAAGGGSGGFGGGGGGGRGAGLYILIQILIRLAIFGHGLGVLIVIGLIVLAVAYTHAAPRARAFWQAREEAGPAARRRASHRQRRVEMAAAEAAEDDPAYAPEVVKAAAADLFRAIQTAWSAGDRARLRQLVAPKLLSEWERRLDDFDRRGWHNHVHLLSDPEVEYLGLTHTGRQQDDRVVVRLQAKLRDYVEDGHGHRIKRAGRLSEITRVREFWTLVRNRSDLPGRAGNSCSAQDPMPAPRGVPWILASIEQGAEGSHALAEQVVATPWSDEQGMRDEAVLEGAAAEAVPEGTRVAEVADLDFTGDARAAALDLSLADGRFAPDVLEVAARRAVSAWAEAVDGDDAALRQVAAPAAVGALLHPGDPDAQTRLVVRGPQVRQIRVAGIDAAAEPPTMSLEVEVEGRRYLEDRATTDVLAGSRSRVSRFTERWTFALTDDEAQPWRIVAASPGALA